MSSAAFEPENLVCNSKHAIQLTTVTDCSFS